MLFLKPLCSLSNLYVSALTFILFYNMVKNGVTYNTSITRVRATAITLVPSMADRASHVTILQRSPTYVVSRPEIDSTAKKLERYLPEQVAYWATRWKNVLSQMILYKMSKKRPEYIKNKLIQWTQLWLGEDFDVATHFSPRYNPWDQRLCLVPNGDLFRSLRKGTSSVVTDNISRFTADGIELESGKVIKKFQKNLK